jgi:micrococcal nuclease
MRRAGVITALAVTVATVAAGCGGGEGNGSPASSEPGAAAVERVVDGDTIRVRVAGRDERVRLIGIDTPESVKPGTPVECFALAAAARTKALLPEGTEVRLVRDVEERDQYGRLLAYVYRTSDDLFVNLSLARDGFAVPLTVPPNVAHASEFVAAAREARENGRGLWAACEGGAIPDG